MQGWAVPPIWQASAAVGIYFLIDLVVSIVAYTIAGIGK